MGHPVHHLDVEDEFVLHRVVDVLGRATGAVPRPAAPQDPRGARRAPCGATGAATGPRRRVVAHPQEPLRQHHVPPAARRPEPLEVLLQVPPLQPGQPESDRLVLRALLAEELVVLEVLARQLHQFRVRGVFSPFSAAVYVGEHLFV